MGAVRRAGRYTVRDLLATQGGVARAIRDAFGGETDSVTTRLDRHRLHELAGYTD